MFGFRSQRSKEEEKAGIQFLASMLVCYPEISSLSYDPRRSTLTFEFIVRGDYPARELDAFARQRFRLALHKDLLHLSLCRPCLYM